MGSCKKTQPPSTVDRCEDPALGAVLPCKSCWQKDYEKELVVNSCGRYFEKYDMNSTRYNYAFSKKFKIYIPLCTGSEATVEIRFKINADSGVTAADVSSAKTKLENGINTYWNGKLTLQVNDPSCGIKTLPIKFKVEWVTAAEHYTMNIHQTYPREGVTGLRVDVSSTTTDWTYAHEFGHCFGLPDEYGYTAGATETVKYYKPDRTLDAAITAPYNGKSSTANDATIMAAVRNTTVLKRHGWFFAIEARDLINESGIGRVIICDII